MKSSHFQSKTELVRKVDDTFRPLHLEISSFKEHAKICNDLRYCLLFYPQLLTIKCCDLEIN